MNNNLNKIIEKDKSGQPITPSILLAYKDGTHINSINNVTGIRISNHMVDPDEFCFDVYKELDGITCNVWDMLKNFMLIHVPRFEKWYQITVGIDEDNNSIKHIDAIQAPQAELSQLMLNEVEIDTEDDIARDDYTWQDTGTLFYDSERPERSLLHRILRDKAPHYSIYHVDESLCKVSRQFSFDGSSILDALNEIAEEVNCLFVFGEHNGHDGNLHRTISAYDMSVVCNNCGERDVIDDACPKCGSTDLYPGYGEFTNTFVSSENLTDTINFTTNTDQIKNCFILTGGDDDMTAAIRNCNPSGSQYIWYFSNEMYDSMSEELRNKLNDYLELSKHYEIDNVFEIDSTAVAQYNTLVEKYHVYDEEIPTIPSEGIQGYSTLIEAEYNVMDFYGYLYSSLLPDADAVEDTTADEQAQNLMELDGQIIGVQKVAGMSKYTADSNILTYAKVFVDTSRYRIEVSSSTFTPNNTTATWSGTFLLTNYLDDEDVATSSTITVTFENNNTAYYQQLVQKTLAKADTDKIGIVALFDKEISEFRTAIKHYSYISLGNLNTIAGTCLGILMPDNIVSEAKSLYDKYLLLQQAIESEYNLRGRELELVDALQESITKVRLETQSQLVLQEFLGDELWTEFSSFRRDDSYGNSNYISDGLTSTQIIEKAREYYNAARREIVKAATAQHTISCNLYDLLFLIPGGSSLLEKFDVGNWIQVGVDDHVYRLRITDYEIDYDDLSTISITFADFTDKQDIASETAQILKNAQSMSTSFGAVARQAEKGEKVSKKIGRYEQEGYSLTAQKIVNSAAEQNMVIDENGILGRHYDEVTDSYDDSQIRIINNGIYYTNDGWETVSSGLGKFIYTDPVSGDEVEGYGIIAKTVVGDLFLGSKLRLYDSSGDSMDDARRVATSFISADDNGIMVSDQRSDTEDPSTATGRNVLIDPDSVDVRDGTDVLASFGANVQIGKNEDYHMSLDSYSMSLETEQNGSSAFKISSAEIYEMRTEEEGVIHPTGTISQFDVDDNCTVNSITVGGTALTNNDWYQDGITVYLDTPTSSTIEYSYTLAEIITVVQPFPTVRIGNESGASRVIIDYNSLKMLDKEDNVFLEARDFRDVDGIATMLDTFIGDGNTTIFNVRFDVSSVVQVAIDGVATSAYTRSNRELTFTNAPANASTITIEYTTTSDQAKEYTLGIREINSNYGALSVAEGRYTTASGHYSHAESYHTIASGDCSHAEGRICGADNDASINVYTTASGHGSHAEGSGTTASNDSAHSEGLGTVASGQVSHAEGYRTTASNAATHSEGFRTVASGEGSHAEGIRCVASSNSCHAEGGETTASGSCSHSQNYKTQAIGTDSTAMGEETIAQGAVQTVIGRFNTAIGTPRNIDWTHPAFIIGNGDADSNRSNAMTVSWLGNTTIAGTLSQSSDRRLKEHIDYLNDDAVEFVQQLKPAHYIKDDQHHVGFYAQDVEEIDNWNCMVGEMNGYKTLGYTEIIAPLVKYCQSLEARIEQLEEKLKEG